MSGPDRALEEAAEALRTAGLFERVLMPDGIYSSVQRSPEDVASIVVSAHLGALRRELPEHAVEAACAAAFWQDDLGGHIKGRWTWESIPDEGRENYRQMARANLEAFLAALTGEGRDDD